MDKQYAHDNYLWCVLSDEGTIWFSGLQEDEAHDIAEDLMLWFPSYTYDGNGGYYEGVACTPEYLRVRVEIVWRLSHE